MRKIFILSTLALITAPAIATPVNLASKKYVDETCVSSNTSGTQTLSGDYTVSGTLMVPTPPLPPED